MLLITWAVHLWLLHCVKWPHGKISSVYAALWDYSGGVPLLVVVVVILYISYALNHITGGAKEVSAWILKGLQATSLRISEILEDHSWHGCMVPSWGRDMRLLNCIVLIPQAVVVLLITKLAALIYHLVLLFKFSLSIWLVLRKLLLLILSLRLHLKVMTAHLGCWVASGVTLLICPLDLHSRFNIFSLGRLERLLSRRSRPFRYIL